MKRSKVVVAVLSVFLSVAGCNKDAGPSQQNNNNNNNGTCNFTTDVVVVDGGTSAVARPNCHVVGTYIAEFLTDTSAAPTGVAIIFATTGAPPAGDYAMVADPASVTAGKVYVEYYDPATAWHSTTGTVTVSVNGATTVVTFCSQSLTAGPSNNKTVSMRGTCN